MDHCRRTQEDFREDECSSEALNIVVVLVRGFVVRRGSREVILVGFPLGFLKFG